MQTEDVESEISRLNKRKTEIINKLNAASDYDTREDLKEELERLKAQIDLLEKLKNK